MSFARPFFLCIALPLSVFAQKLDENDPKPLPALEQLKRFKVPPGFEVQLVADETQIHKPININFDSAGRLWTSGSQHYPWPAATDAAGNRISNFEKTYDEMANAFGAKGKAPPFSVEAKDTVRILSAFGPDGRAQKSVIFADKLNIPSGVQPLPATRGSKATSAVIYSIPNIWLMTDTDGDGSADKRDMLYGPFGFLDTHGGSSSYNYWIDGWIYGTHGFRNHSEVKDRTGKVTIFDSGNTYRFKPDGSKIEYWSHGQTNPFGLAFDPFGNLYSADCHSKPVYLLLRGGYYEGLGNQHDGLGFAPAITNDDHGSTGICGIAYYAAEQFPADYRDNIFIGNCVTGRINRDKLEWHGSTPKAIRQPDFLTCDDPWFRPVDVKLGPDGALYIADFYNYIIGHYENPLLDPRRDNSRGRIWRVVYRGDAKELKNAPDFTKFESAALVNAMRESNLISRVLALHEFVARNDQNLLPALTAPGLGEGPDRARVLGLWAVARMARSANTASALARLSPGNPRDEAQRLVATATTNTAAMDDQEGLVRSEFLKSSADLAEPAPPVLAAIRNALNDRDPHVQRSAALATAAHERAENIEPLVNLCLSSPQDQQLLHAARIALRNNLLAPGAFATATPIAERNPQAAKLLANVSLGARSPEAAQFLLAQITRTDLPTFRRAEHWRHVAMHLAVDRLAELARSIEMLANLSPTQALEIAHSLDDAARKRNIRLPQELTAWTQQTMLQALDSPDEGVLKRAIESVRELNLEAKAEPLARISRETKWAGPLRTAALDALANTERATEAWIVALNDPSSMTLRKRAAELLAQKCAGAAPAPPGSAADPCATLLAALPIAPWELATTIAAGLAKHDASCNALVALVETGKASAALLRHKTVAVPLAERSARLKERAAELTKDLPPEDARLDQLIAQRVTEYRAAKQDPSHGAQVFQQHCAVCHKVNNVGGSLAPNLDGMAARGLHRLLEDILDPNRNVDPAFAQVVIETKDGQMFAGVGPRIEGELIILNDAQGKPISVSKAQVKTQTQSRLSLMPPAFEQLLSGKDLNDVIAFLLTQSAPPAK